MDDIGCTETKQRVQSPRRICYSIPFPRKKAKAAATTSFGTNAVLAGVCTFRLVLSMLQSLELK